MPTSENNTPGQPENDVNDIFKKKTENTTAAPGTPPATTPEVKSEEKAKNEKEANEGGNNILTFFIELATNLLVVFGLVFIIQFFIASPFRVYGVSMCDTLNLINDECINDYGEYIIVNKLVYKDFFGFHIRDPQRGDIIVFHPPHTQEQFYIKRVIGVPGDTVKIIDGKIFIFNDENPTGFELTEDYLNGENFDNTLPSINKRTTFEVPEGKYFVMGDNRGHSTDSRHCFRDDFQGGCRGKDDYFLPKENIEGKAWVVLFPFNKIRVIPKAEY